MWQQAVNSRSQEQPVPGMDYIVPQVAAAGYEERQTDDIPQDHAAGLQGIWSWAGNNMAG